MKTIAISIGEDTISSIDNLLSSGANLPWHNRSAFIRYAVHELLARLDRSAEEERERQIFRRARSRLNRQAEALIKDQAKT